MLFPKQKPVTVYVYSIFACLSAFTVALTYFFELFPDSFMSACVECIFLDLTTLMMISGMIFNIHIYVPIVITIIVLLLSSVMMYTRWIKATSYIMLALLALDISFLFLMIFESYEILFAIIFRIFIILVCYDNIKWCKKQAEVKSVEKNQ